MLGKRGFMGSTGVINRSGVIYPSLMSADPLNLESEIQSLMEIGAGAVHIDMLDGVFAPNLSGFNVGSLKAISERFPKLYLDVHLMVCQPLLHLPAILPFASRVSVHVESEGFLEALDLIQQGGAEVSVAINPDTTVDLLQGVLDHIDNICIMGVNPGFSGQKFIEGTLEKISMLKQMREDRSFTLQVDGGIDEGTLLQCRIAGADQFVSGSTLFVSEDRKKAFSALNSIFQEVN